MVLIWPKNRRSRGTKFEPFFGTTRKIPGDGLRGPNTPKKWKSFREISVISTSFDRPFMVAIGFSPGGPHRIPYSYVSPLAYVKTNVEGTYNVLQAARECGVERVVHTSTSEVYGTAQYIPIDEGHPITPQSPYSATKASADYLALSYYRSFSLPVTVVRPFNTYGPRQSARAIIPTIISQLLDGKEVISLGNLTPTRDLTFVDDTVLGFLAASEAPVPWARY